MNYWTCPDCDANLDYDEKCDCRIEENYGIIQINKNCIYRPHQKFNTRTSNKPISDDTEIIIAE